MRIRYGGKYRVVISRGKLPYLKIGKTLYRIYIRGRYWNIRRGRRLLRLPKVARYYFMRKWRQAKCSGKRLYIRYMRRWFRVIRQKGYTIRYRGRKLRVKRTRKGYKVRFGGRYGKARRGKMETKLKKLFIYPSDAPKVTRGPLKSLTENMEKPQGNVVASNFFNKN